MGGVAGRGHTSSGPSTYYCGASPGDCPTGYTNANGAGGAVSFADCDSGSIGRGSRGSGQRLRRNRNDRSRKMTIEAWIALALVAAAVAWAWVILSGWKAGNHLLVVAERGYWALVLIVELLTHANRTGRVHQPDLISVGMFATVALFSMAYGVRLKKEGRRPLLLFLAGAYVTCIAVLLGLSLFHPAVVLLEAAVAVILLAGVAARLGVLR